VRLARVSAARANVAVVGHVEWVQFAHVERVPLAGEVVHARDAFAEPAGGGAVAAVKLARLAGRCIFYTALGADEEGRRSLERLGELGVDVRASSSSQPTRRAVTLLDAAGERTITTFGARLEPFGEPGQAAVLDGGPFDAIYFTAGDAATLAAARAACRVLVVSPRARDATGHGVELDALVLSDDDQIERRAAASAEREAALVVYSEGARGGRYERRSGESGRWAPVAPPAAAVDSYGCGDSFAAGLTYGLGRGLTLAEALAVGARCGAECLTFAGPYERRPGRDL